MTEFFSTRFMTVTNFWHSQHFVLADLKNLTTWNYWTAANLNVASPEYLPTTIGVIIILGLLIFWRSRLKKLEAIAPVYQSAINQLANIVVFIIVVGLTYPFFRAEAINYLSSRLVLLITLIIILVWISWVGYYQLRIAPSKAKEYLERERFFRYIPKGNAKLKRQKAK